MSTVVLDVLRSKGFSPRLYWPEPADPTRPVRPAPHLMVDGAVPLPDELKQQVRNERDALKASLLLLAPPPWLVILLNLYSGAANPLQKNSKRELPPPTLSTIAAAVAEAVGIDARKRAKVLSEVEAAARAWEPGKVVPLQAGDPP